MNKKIYVAASFSYLDQAKTNKRKSEIKVVVNKIKKLSKVEYNWFLPQNIEVPDAWKLSLEEWSREVYKKDLDALEEADIVLFISYGKENNSGSAWETGYAFAKNKPIIMIKMNDEVESLMLFGSAHAIMMYSEIEIYDWESLPRYMTKLSRLS